jgi:hypothetical protein
LISLDELPRSSVNEMFRGWFKSMFWRYVTYVRKHLPTTILAATVAATGGKPYILNVKHHPMPEIVVVRGW